MLSNLQDLTSIQCLLCIPESRHNDKYRQGLALLLANDLGIALAPNVNDACFPGQFNQF
jgi:hypothetical protein